MSCALLQGRLFKVSVFLCFPAAERQRVLDRPASGEALCGRLRSADSDDQRPDESAPVGHPRRILNCRHLQSSRAGFGHSYWPMHAKCFPVMQELMKTQCNLPESSVKLVDGDLQHPPSSLGCFACALVLIVRYCGMSRRVQDRERYALSRQSLVVSSPHSTIALVRRAAQADEDGLLGGHRLRIELRPGRHGEHPSHHSGSRRFPTGG